MAGTMLLEILTPENVFYTGQISRLVAEQTDGAEGYLPGHAPVMKLLKEGGTLRFQDEEGEKRVLVQGGHIGVSDRILIFTPGARWKEDAQ